MVYARATISRWWTFIQHKSRGVLTGISTPPEDIFLMPIFEYLLLHLSEINPAGYWLKQLNTSLKNIPPSRDGIYSTRGTTLLPLKIIRGTH